MAALDFPTSPAVGDKWPTPSVAGQPQYTWDGVKWTTPFGPVPGLLVTAPDPPTNPTDNTLWFDTESGILFMRYKDADNTSQWVAAGAGQGLPGPQGLTGPMGPVGNPLTRYDVGGLTVKDVTVPTDAVGARISGMLYIPTSASSRLELQLSVAPGVFRNTVGDYNTYGMQHSSNTPASITGYSSVGAYSGIILQPGHDNTTVPMSFSGIVTLKRPTTSTVFSYTGHGNSFLASNGNINHLISNFLQLAASGSALSVLAMRFTGAPATTWVAGSYITVEFF